MSQLTLSLSPTYLATSSLGQSHRSTDAPLFPVDLPVILKWADSEVRWVDVNGSKMRLWSVEPDIRKIQTACGNGPLVPVYRKGIKNKIYMGKGENGTLFVLRLASPMETPRKTESEVATMLYIDELTVNLSPNH